jgi:hypothetical protein
MQLLMSIMGCWPMGKNHHHTPTFKYQLTKRLRNLPISTPPPRLWTMEMKEGFSNLNLVVLLDSLVGFLLYPAAVSHVAFFVLYYDKIDLSFIFPETLIFL